MSPHYQHLSMTEREELSRMLASGSSLRFIAKTLKRSPGTLSRELDRNQMSGISYRAVAAQDHADRLAHLPRKKRKLDYNLRLRRVIFKLLSKRWSPEQIANRLALRYPTEVDMRVSHETLYAYLYVLACGQLKRQLIRCLRRHHHARRPRSKIRLKTNPVQDMISIEKRPAEVSDRSIPGHWEGDLLIGRANGSALGTLVERTTRFTLLAPLKTKDAVGVRQAFTREMRTLPQQLKRSLTYDQGQEMREHRLFTKQTRIQVFFAHPHSPWERGTNENTNGLIRQFFPKGTDFAKISRYQIKQVQKLLNERPRKVLKWLTPSETFSNLLH